jgi:DNA (cytosine-5)-methyltransferase 1
VDTPPTNHLSFCAGYGGIDLALKSVVQTCRTIAYVEIEAFAIANLVAKMEAGELDQAPVWTDVKTFPAEQFHGLVDIVSGGYPCQPFSAAGKRLGTEDPRHLWPFLRGAVRAIRPGRVFLENVEGHISLGLPTVLSDLDEDGYDATWGIFSAAEVGASHQRKRVFILGRLANTGNIPSAYRRSRTVNGGGSGETKEISFEPANEQERGDRQARQRKNTSSDTGKCGNGGADVANGKCAGLEGHSGDEQDETGSERTGPDRPVGPSGVPQRFPARPGQPQFDWEESRTIIPGLDGTTDGSTSGVDATAHRVDRLRLLGNGVVPATAAKAWTVLSGRFE